MNGAIPSILLSTVNAKLDWNTYLGTLRAKGRLHIVGATLEPLDIAVFPLLMDKDLSQLLPLAVQAI